jgi:hypothetical protein
MLQPNAAPVVTSNPLRVNRKPCISRNREVLGGMRDRGRKASPPAPAGWSSSTKCEACRTLRSGSPLR